MLTFPLPSQEPSPYSPIEELSYPIRGQFRSIPSSVFPQAKSPMKSLSQYPSKIDSSNLSSCIISLSGLTQGTILDLRLYIISKQLLEGRLKYAYHDLPKTA
jgi:hypothetical protein